MKVLKSNTREENFSTLARHFKCSFLQVCEETGLPVRLFKNKFTPQKKKMICFKSWSYLHTCGKFIIQAPSKWTYTNETEYFGTVQFLLSGRFAFITKILHWMKTAVTIKFFKTDQTRVTYHCYGKQLCWSVLKCFCDSLRTEGVNG